MPMLQIFTTLSRTQVPENLGQIAAHLLAKTLPNKKLDRICVHVLTEQQIFSGSAPDQSVPNAYAILRSIGSVSLDDNRKTVVALADLIQQQLSIDPKQFRVFFYNHSPDMVGLDGKVATDLAPKPAK